ncbi:MAG: methyltransferase domain-containing protein [Planctomycetota bacterium]|nr:methyltransferase domain-containing protein [Planctomycetota bacterium]
MKPEPASLRELYDNHPLTEASILERVRKEGKDLNALTEEDLCRDPQGGITDQNHIGGADAVRRLAAEAEVTGSSVVLDIGCGLGGPARVLADKSGCHVVGIDLTLSRLAAAIRLTRKISMKGRASFAAGDARHLPLLEGRIDVIWGQSAWLHIPEKKRLLEECWRVLCPGGMIAMEDTFLGDAPGGGAADQVDRLSRIWMAHLISLRGWTDLISRSGFEVTSTADLTPLLSRSATRMLRVLGGTDWPDEKEAWVIADRLAANGRIVYSRVLARKREKGGQAPLSS